MDDKLKELIFKLEDCYNISTKPTNITKLKTNHIQDENMSVAWNRNYIEENNLEYCKTVAKLQRNRDLAIDKAEENIVKYIAKETKLTKEKAKLIWDYAFKERHDCSLNAVGYMIE